MALSGDIGCSTLCPDVPEMGFKSWMFLGSWGVGVGLMDLGEWNCLEGAVGISKIRRYSRFRSWKLC